MDHVLFRSSDDSRGRDGRGKKIDLIAVAARLLQNVPLDDVGVVARRKTTG